MGVDLETALPDVAIALDASAADWREAVRLAGERLTASGATTPEYTAEMIAAIEKLGPYIVIAPGIALAHSRPSPAVLRTGLSWVRLATPVEFGNSQNDPVGLVIGLAAVDHDAHLTVLSQVASALMEPNSRAALNAATDAAAIRAALSSADEKGTWS